MRVGGVWLLLGVLIGGVYANALHNSFVFDDYQLVVEQPLLARLATEPGLLLSPLTLGQRPLRTISYAVDYQIGGLQPWIFHLSNVLYHWLAAGLVFLIARDLTARPSAVIDAGTLRLPPAQMRLALIAALLWALHPIHTDAVTYISGRRDILGGLFFFLGVWAYLRFRRTSRAWWLGLASLAYGLGLLSKESVVVLPVVWWLSDSQREGMGRALRSHIVLYSVVLLGGAAVLWGAAGSQILAAAQHLSWHGGSVLSNVATVLRIWVHYLTVLVFPRTLIADYSYDAFPVSLSFWEPDVLAALGILGGVTIGIIVLARRVPFVGYGALWMLITLVPVSHLIPIQEIVAEHYLYVPAFGLCLILATLLDTACSVGLQADQPGRARLRAAVVYGLVLVLLVGAGARIVVRNRDWRDEETLWTVTTHAVPRCARAHYNLAGEYLRQERFEEAKREFAVTIAIRPNEVEALTGLGEIAFRTGLYGQAFGYVTQAEQIAPNHFRVQYLLGWIFLALKKPDEAEPYFEKAAELQPLYAGTYAGLEAVAKARGDSAAATRWAERRRALEPKAESAATPPAS